MADNQAYNSEKLPEQAYPHATRPEQRYPQAPIHPPSYEHPTTSVGVGEIPSQQQPQFTGYPTQPTVAQYQQQTTAEIYSPRQCCYGAIQSTPTRSCCGCATSNAISSTNDWKSRIPVMPMWLACTCLVINCILPGFGTLIASFSLCCCSHAGVAGRGACRSYCSTFWVGWAQMISIIFLLVGYVWAIAWSIASISVSKQYYGKDPSQMLIHEEHRGQHTCTCQAQAHHPANSAHVINVNYT